MLLRAFVFAALCVPCSLAQSTVSLTSVRAHEDFLASDALNGRGSATRDEQITATYVASEFESYGLQPAPGMQGYIQTAEIVAPVLDGHATLTAGSVTAQEGAEFTLARSGGESFAGPLVKVDAAAKSLPPMPANAVVLLTPAAGITMRNASRAVSMQVYSAKGAAVLLVADDSTTSMTSSGRTPVRMHLAGQPAPRDLTRAVLSPQLARRLQALPDGTPVSFTLHALPPAAPRATYNAIGYLLGNDPSDGTLLLSAHLDHLGISTPVNGDAIYNGANDDASGTTAVLELAQALAAGPRPRRSVLFVCYGSEEAGELGSTYFGQHPPVPLRDLVANLEFEMIGNQDPKMPKGFLLLTGWDRSDLGPTLRAHGALLGPDPYPEQHFFERSDNYALALQGVVAHTAAGWGTPPTYHQPDDDLEHLDLAFMTAAIQSLVEPVRWLASSTFTPHWNQGGQPHR